MPTAVNLPVPKEELVELKPKREAIPVPQDEVLKTTTIADDRGDIQPGDMVLLLIEDDINFARVLYDISRQEGYELPRRIDGRGF